MILRIESIAFSHCSLFLTRNVVGFQQVPGLRVENWLIEFSGCDRRPSTSGALQG